MLAKHQRRVASFLSQQIRKLSFDQNLTNDKWAKDGMKYPFEISGKTTGADLAVNLFRHAYNTNQLGYFYLGVQAASKYVQENKVPSNMKDETVLSSFYNAGVPDEITHEVIPFLLNLGLPEEVKTFFDVYTRYYLAYNKLALHGKFYFGGRPFSPKYTHYVNRAMILSSTQLTENNLRIQYSFDVAPEDIGGWRAELGANQVNNTYAWQFSSASSEEDSKI